VFSVDTAQVYTSGLAEKEPGVYKKAAKYLAGLFKVATVITNPTIETHSAGMICSDRDLILSEFHAQAQETKAAKMYGGAVIRSATWLEARSSTGRDRSCSTPNPRPLTMVGKKKL
jgi:hypothetical protein